MPLALTAHNVIDALQDAALVVDTKIHMEYVNAAMQELWPTLAIAQHLSLHVRKPELLSAIEAVLLSGQPKQVHFSQKIPVERNFVSHISPIYHQDVVTPAAALVVIRDLTRDQKIEQMRVDFIANASHELKTPIASLLGFIETLQGPARDDTPARIQFLGIMKTQALRMARLVDDLLSLSRIELLEHVAPDEACDFSKIITSVVESLQVVAAENGVELRINIPNAAPLIGDADALYRVVENLVENAIKYGSAGQFVDITLAATKNNDRPMWQLRVQDYGAGIDEAHLPRLTERFYRVDEARSREKGGTGLGLAIVKHIVNRHKGQLQFESVQGKGTSVCVWLSQV